MKIEIGRNLKSVLKQMIKECPEEIKHIMVPPSDLIESFLKNENIEGWTWELEKSGSGNSVEIVLRKIKKE